MGQKLAASLNKLIDAKVSDDMSRSDIVGTMARTVDMDLEDIDQILQGELLCPPLDRLDGFAEVLGTTVSELRISAEADGCDYSERGEGATRQVTIKEVIPREQYERLQRVKEELERALNS